MASTVRYSNITANPIDFYHTAKALCKAPGFGADTRMGGNHVLEYKKNQLFSQAVGNEPWQIVVAFQMMALNRSSWPDPVPRDISTRRFVTAGEIVRWLEPHMDAKRRMELQRQQHAKSFSVVQDMKPGLISVSSMCVSPVLSKSISSPDSGFEERVHVGTESPGLAAKQESDRPGHAAEEVAPATSVFQKPDPAARLKIQKRYFSDDRVQYLMTFQAANFPDYLQALRFRKLVRKAAQDPQLVPLLSLGQKLDLPMAFRRFVANCSKDTFAQLLEYASKTSSVWKPVNIWLGLLSQTSLEGTDFCRVYARLQFAGLQDGLWLTWRYAQDALVYSQAGTRFWQYMLADQFRHFFTFVQHYDTTTDRDRALAIHEARAMEYFQDSDQSANA